MAIPRYEKELEEIASPRFRRWVLRWFGIAALIGLGIGIVWVLAGILNFQVLR
jgi:hypothetical protein